MNIVVSTLVTLFSLFLCQGMSISEAKFNTLRPQLLSSINPSRYAENLRRKQVNVQLCDKQGLHARPFSCLRFVASSIVRNFPSIEEINLSLEVLPEKKIDLSKSTVTSLLVFAGDIMIKLGLGSTNLPDPNLIIEIVGKKEDRVLDGLCKIMEGAIKRVGDDYKEGDAWQKINKPFLAWLYTEIDKLETEHLIISNPVNSDI